MSTTTRTEFDFVKGATYDDPWEMYAWLRSLDGLHRDEKNDLWIAAKHEDVFHFSRKAELYCSAKGVRPIIAADMSIITMDAPQHTQVRRLINKGFTPRQVRALIPHVRRLTNDLIDEIGAKGEIDVIDDLAIHIPLIVICEMMGLDPETRLQMYAWSDAMMDGDGHADPDSPQLHAAAEAFGAYAMAITPLIEERRKDPKNDLISILTSAAEEGTIVKQDKGSSVQGVQDQDVLADMPDDDLFLFLTLLVVAGNETTRNAIAGGILALSEHPEQKAQLLEHLWDDAWMDTAIDEIVRYVTPILTFMRTVTSEHVYKGHTLKEGDRVLMLYGAANRDEAKFDRPDELDLERTPNEHLSFGSGPHFCLGANLARMEIKTVYQELFSRLPDMAVRPGHVHGRADSTLVLGLTDIEGVFEPESDERRASAHAAFEARCPVDH